MRELEKRQKIRKNLYSLPALSVLLIVAFFSAKGAYTMVRKAIMSDKEALALTQKTEALERRELELRNEAEKLQTNEGIEEEIKSRFNVARAGEEVALIVDKGERATTTTEKEASWWKRFWGGIIRGQQEAE